MSSDAMVNIRGYLISSSNVTSKVPAKNIIVGWRKTLSEFPCIVINQISGTDTGFLGYGSPTNRTRREQCMFSIDIFSRTSREQTYSVADSIVPLLIVSGSCKKVNDVDMYDDSLSVYRKLQTYSYTLFHSD